MTDKQYRNKALFQNETVVITDPCYLKRSHAKIEASTHVGDWTCMVYPGTLQSNEVYKEYNTRRLEYLSRIKNAITESQRDALRFEFSRYRRDWMEEHTFGQFCADGGNVGVFDWKYLAKEDQQWVDGHAWAATIIPDFTGVVYFFDSAHGVRHVIGEGDKPFFSVQCGF